MEKTNRCEINKYVKGSKVSLCVCVGTCMRAIVILRRLFGIALFEKMAFEQGPKGRRGRVMRVWRECAQLVQRP